MPLYVCIYAYVFEWTLLTETSPYPSTQNAPQLSASSLFDISECWSSKVLILYRRFWTPDLL